MTDRPTDRLWPPSALSEAERARARAAFEAAPDLLERLVIGSTIGKGHDKLDQIEGLIRRVRCPAT